MPGLPALFQALQEQRGGAPTAPGMQGVLASILAGLHPPGPGPFSLIKPATGEGNVQSANPLFRAVPRT